MADEGLEWLLSLDVEQDEAVSFLKTLDKMTSSLKTVSKDVDHVEDASGHAANGHRKHGAEAKNLDGVLNHLHHATLGPLIERMKSIAEFEFIRRGVDALIEAPMEAFEKLKELGEEMITTAAKAERTEKSFDLMFGHEGAEQLLGYLEKIRRTTEFTGEELEGAAVSLGMVGFKGEGLGRALSAAKDLAALSRDPKEGFQSALFGLEQAKRTGVVSNRTLRPLGIGENDFLRELSARTGRDFGTLKKALSTGKLDAEQSLETLYEMITKKTGKKLGGAGVDMSKTLSAEITHLGELPELFLKKLAKSPGLDVLKTELSKLLDALDPESQNGKRIFGALENVFKTIGDTMKTFDMASVVTTAIDALETFTIMFLELLSLVPGDVGDRASFVLNETKRRRENNQRDATERKDLAAMGTTPEFEDAADMADLEAAEKSGALAADGFAKGMKDATPAAAEAAKSMGDAAADATRERLGIHSPSRVYAEFGRMIGAGLIDGIDDSADNVDRAVGEMFPAQKAGGGRVMSVSVGGISVSVSVPGGSSATAEQIGEATARAVESILPGALQSALATIALQAGGSN